MYTIINITSIISKFHARAWPWHNIFCLYHIWVEADIPLGKIVLHASGPGVLWRCCGLSIRLGPYCRQKSSPTIILWGKLGQGEWINKTSLNEWCRQIKINGLESHLLVQIAVLLKFSAFPSTILQSSNCILIRISNS